MSHSIPLYKFLDPAIISPRLVRAGLGEQAAAEKAELLNKSAQALRQAGIADEIEANAFFVPGRIEVLGKHTDYAGGRSIVAATDRGFCLIATRRDDSTVRITDAASDEEVAFPLSSQLAVKTGHWSNYPMTVARRISRNFPGSLCGADIAFAGDLPPAAGMSSSSALMIAIFLALSRVNHLDRHDAYLSNIDGMESLAGYLATIENGQSFAALTGDKGVGTFGGSEDHTAILNCKTGMLSQYSYCPVRFERLIAVPAGYIFAVATSGVIAEKTGAALAKYNRASQLASAVVQIWRDETGRDDPHLAAAISSSADAADRMRSILQRRGHADFTADELTDRFEQFYAESEQIIPAAGEALIKKDMAEFAVQVDRSQELAQNKLGNQVEQTIFLAHCARQLGAVGASAFGAGFGGSLWALTAIDTAKKFLQNWAEQYHEKFPQLAAQSSFFLTQPGPAAFEPGLSG